MRTNLICFTALLFLPFACGSETDADNEVLDVETTPGASSEAGGAVDVDPPSDVSTESRDAGANLGQEGSSSESMSAEGDAGIEVSAGGDAGDSLSEDAGDGLGIDAGGGVASGGNPDSGGAIKPTTFPRIVVARNSNDGLSVWDNANQLSGTPSPDLMVSGVDSVERLTLSGSSLVAFGTGPNAAFILRDIANAGPGVTFDDRIERSTLTTAAQFLLFDGHVDGSGNIWFASDNIYKVHDGLSMGASTVTAFAHPFQQVYAVARDDVGDKLIGGQISGGGVVAWNAPDRRSGTGNEPDFVIADVSCWRLVIKDDRLYGACSGSVLIWDNVSAITAMTAPSVEILGVAGFLDDLDVSNDFLVTANGQDINIWESASTISTSRAADHTITLGDDVCSAGGSLKVAIMGSDENLYALDGSGRLIRISNALETPVCEAEISVSDAEDLLLLE